MERLGGAYATSVHDLRLLAILPLRWRERFLRTGKKQRLENGLIFVQFARTYRV